MSGTSMDGLDIALTSFVENKGEWSFDLLHCKTYSYTEDWIKKLSTSKVLSGIELTILDAELGKLFAQNVNNFLREFSIEAESIDFIASHGHTVFHQPERGFTLQIGCGESLSFLTEIPVINDFRTKNVLAGGQGAPLVPIGDKYLFSEYDACINIGGFTNITLNQHGHPLIAFDISPGNLPINLLAQQLGKQYDENGEIARQGKTDLELLNTLNQIDYYSLTPPKSLGTEWLENQFLNCLDAETDTSDKINTITEHIADQITRVLNSHEIRKALITGGGAKNTYLIERIRSKTNAEIVIPMSEIIDFKEALIFGFLGCLNQLNKPNSLASVTGSRRDVIGGAYHKP